MGVLSAMIVMLDANSGYCGEGHRGGALKGVKGGLDEVVFNAMLGYMVEGHVFPLIGNGVDFIGDYFGVNPRTIYFRNGAVFDKSGNLIDGK